MEYVLGVDAGATKTMCLIADASSGEILGSGEAGPANFHLYKDTTFIDNIQEAIARAEKELGEDDLNYYSIAFGIAGLDTEKNKREAEELLNNIHTVQSSDKVLIQNDVTLVRPACSEKEAGVSVVLGTGSNFYGTNGKGKELRVGGLDWLLSDEASAYWIGARALRAAVRSGDGRGEKTVIEDLLLERFNIEFHRELVDVVYERKFGKTEVAELAKIVDTAYEKDDNVAIRILEEATEEVVNNINLIIKKLELEGEDYDIVAIGGQLNSPFPFKEKITSKLGNTNTEFIICERDPVYGAIKLALNL